MPQISLFVSSTVAESEWKNVAAVGVQTDSKRAFGVGSDTVKKGTRERLVEGKKMKPKGDVH